MNGISIAPKKSNIALYKIRSRKHEKELAELLSKIKFEKGLCFREMSELTGLNMTRLNNLLNAMDVVSIKIDEIVCFCKIFDIELVVNKDGVQIKNNNGVEPKER